MITIDPVDARDFDDAISLEQTEKGHWRLGVHIADVSHFVRPEDGRSIARRMHRATSVYLPDRVMPMLPEMISNGLASLQPDRVRYTKTVFIEFTPEGIPRRRRADVGGDQEPPPLHLRRGRRVPGRSAKPGEPSSTPEVHALLADMHELAMMLRRRRMKRGALELTMPEVKIDLDREGAGQRGSSRRRTPKAIRSSKSSCWPPTKPWPKCWPRPSCTSCGACIRRPTCASSRP